MSLWWVRTLVRLVVALLLPLSVPCIIVYLIWALPGDPASLICPPELCPNTDALAARWNLDQGPWHFFASWLGAAMEGDSAAWAPVLGGSLWQWMAVFTSS